MNLLFILFSFVIYNVCALKNNVLFIIMDDFKPAIGVYGDPNAYTPNIDKLASKSFLFTRTYSQVSGL